MKTEQANGTRLGAPATTIIGAVVMLLLLPPAAFADAVYVSSCPCASGCGIMRFTPSGIGSIFTCGPTGLYGLAYDGAGNLYAADSHNMIEEFTPDGDRSIFSSSATGGPTGLAFDSAGNLYAAALSDRRILKFTPTGAVSVFASNGVSGPQGLAFDSAGNLYVANYNSNTIEKFTPGGVLSVFALDPGDGSVLNAPYGLAFDGAGNLYVANSGNSRIEKFTPAGVGSVFATNGLNAPRGLAFDSSGNLYVVNGGDGTIERFTAAGAGSFFANAGDTFDTGFIAIVPSPFIRIQPQGQVGCLGGTASFSVSALGGQPITYQWLFGNTVLAGETNAQLALANLQQTNAGAYSVVVSNAFGSVTSSNAQLILNDACVDIRMYAGLNISGLDGATYVLKYTTDVGVTNFANWIPLATNTLTGSNWFYVDRESPFSPRRFYGVKLAP